MKIKKIKLFFIILFVFILLLSSCAGDAIEPSKPVIEFIENWNQTLKGDLINIWAQDKDRTDAFIDKDLRYNLFIDLDDLQKKGNGNNTTDNYFAHIYNPLAFFQMDVSYQEREDGDWFYISITNKQALHEDNSRGKFFLLNASAAHAAEALIYYIVEDYDITRKIVDKLNLFKFVALEDDILSQKRIMESDLLQEDYSGKFYYNEYRDFDIEFELNENTKDLYSIYYIGYL